MSYLQDSFEREYKMRRYGSEGNLHRSTSYNIHSYSSGPKVYTIKRSSSLSGLPIVPLSPRYKSQWDSSNVASNRYRRDWDLYDEYWWDRSYYNTPLRWPYYPFAGRRYNYFDAPYSLWWYYPGPSYYPRTRWSYLDSDPLYWQRYRNPNYDPVYSYYLRPYSAWKSESEEVKRGVSLYKQNLITFDTIDRFWLRPSYWERRFWDYRNMRYPYY